MGGRQALSLTRCLTFTGFKRNRYDILCADILVLGASNQTLFIERVFGAVVQAALQGEPECV